MADKADLCVLVSAGAEWRALLPHYPEAEIESSPYGECFFTQVGNQCAWFLHARFPDPTLADAILDRLVHNAHRVELQGESQRKLRAPRTMSST